MPPRTGPRTRRWRRAVRRRVLAHRRALAAALTGLAAFAAVQVASPDPPERVAVTVAARALPAGEVVGHGDVVTALLPRDAVPDQTATDPVGRVLAGALTRGEVVTDVRLVGAGLAGAQPGRTTVPLRLPDAGVAALLGPGDEVDLVATDPATGRAEVVATGAVVLAVPRQLPDGSSTGDGAVTVLSLRPEDALPATGAALTRYLSVTLNG